MVNLFFASVLIVLYSTHVGPLFTFTILFIISLICLFIYYGFRFLTPFTQIIGVCIMFTQVVSYFLTAIINPGIPKRDLFIMKGNKKLQTDELVGKMKWCEYCDIINKEESNTRHCYDCEICVEGYDHHCPWTSKCIGKGNIRLFNVFLCSTLLLFGYLFYGVAMVKN